MLSLVHSPRYRLEWPGHVFPVEKYVLVRRRLIEDGTATERHFLEPQPATDEELELVHPRSYLERLERLAAEPERGYLEFEVPVSREVIAAFRSMTGGTLLAAREALARGAAVNLGGGFHHAFAERGEGFCLLNDVAVAVRAMLREGRARRCSVIDLDLHQGNGTAAIFRDDPSVHTFSMHQERLYPVKERSDLDVGLDDFTGDADYLERLAAALPPILDRYSPDLAFYLAGADPFEDDQLGNLQLTKDGLARRDGLVFDELRARGVPVVAVLAGGYARRSEDVVDIHVRMVHEALARFGPLAPP